MHAQCTLLHSIQSRTVLSSSLISSRQLTLLRCHLLDETFMKTCLPRSIIMPDKNWLHLSALCSHYHQQVSWLHDSLARPYANLHIDPDTLVKCNWKNASLYRPPQLTEPLTPVLLRGMHIHERTHKLEAGEVWYAPSTKGMVFNWVQHS